jgi:hypothetical protein
MIDTLKKHHRINNKKDTQIRSKELNLGGAGVHQMNGTSIP